jgi:hypothetical protein
MNLYCILFLFISYPIYNWKLNVIYYKIISVSNFHRVRPIFKVMIEILIASLVWEPLAPAIYNDIYRDIWISIICHSTAMYIGLFGKRYFTNLIMVFY